MSMTRIYHKLQTNPRHREEDPQDIRTTIKAKQPALSLSPPCQDDCKTRKKNIKLCIAKTKTTLERPQRMRGT